MTEFVLNFWKIVSREEWLAARKDLLVKEKAFDHERDKLTECRRKLPMLKVEKEYVFDGPVGPIDLRALFQGRQQLIVYHFMFEPSRMTGCKHCSCVMDNIAGALVHLTARDTSFAAVSRAPIAKIQAFKRRMGWDFPWVSSFHNDFNYDFQVTLDSGKGYTVHNYRPFDFEGELPGLSVFVSNRGMLLHSYSTYLRGLDILLPMYHLLDRTPLGRQETKENSMAAGEASWIRYHDAYETTGEQPGGCCKSDAPM